MLGLYDKEGEDQCVWIRVSAGARGFIPLFNSYVLGAYSILGTGNTKGLNILCLCLVYIPLRKTGKQGDT